MMEKTPDAVAGFQNSVGFELIFLKAISHWEMLLAHPL